jgi:nitroreductase
MIELLRDRRTIRVYENRPVAPESVEILKEAALRSPSSRRKDPWQFVFVESREKIETLSRCKEHGSGVLKGAPFAIVVCADENVSDVWVEDCSIASILLQLTAQSLGLGSCWVQVRNRRHSEEISSDRYVHDVLELPEHWRVESIIAVGYPAEQREGKPREELDYGKIRYVTG